MSHGWRADKPISRRELIGFAAGMALWPHAAIAQQPMPTIGFLHGGSVALARLELIAFWQEMSWAGFAEHVNIACEYRWAEGHDERLPFLAADLARRELSLIVAGGASPAMAAKRATGTIPIVFVAASDPVRSGFVDSLNHPGGNITGISLAAPELLAKRFQTHASARSQFDKYGRAGEPRSAEHRRSIAVSK